MRVTALPDEEEGGFADFQSAFQSAPAQVCLQSTLGFCKAAMQLHASRLAQGGALSASSKRLYGHGSGLFLSPPCAAVRTHIRCVLCRAQAAGQKGTAGAGQTPRGSPPRSACTGRAPKARIQAQATSVALAREIT